MRRITRVAAALAAASVVGVGGVATAANAAGHGSGFGGAGQVTVRNGACTADRAGSGGGRAGGTRGTGVGGPTSAGRTGRVPAAVPGATISAAVAEQLAFMVQEEKLARDVYALAATLYPDRIFATIMRAESSHMASLRILLDRYDVADPTVGAKAGVFADDDLQDLYTKLAAQVRVSREQAVQAGITVEVADIADLQEALTLKAPSDVTTVLGNLLAGSQRHLAAFQRNA